MTLKVIILKLHKSAVELATQELHNELTQAKRDPNKLLSLQRLDAFSDKDKKTVLQKLVNTIINEDKNSTAFFGHLIFQLINYAGKKFSEISKELKSFKESVFVYMENKLDSHTRVKTYKAILSNAAHPLYFYFHTPRGFFAPTEQSGVLGLIRKALEKEVEQIAIHLDTETEMTIVTPYTRII